MIEVSKLNKEKFYINADLIEFIEEKPDTIVSLQSGRHVVVSESAEEVIRRIVAYKRGIYTNFVE